MLSWVSVSAFLSVFWQRRMWQQSCETASTCEKWDIRDVSLWFHKQQHRNLSVIVRWALHDEESKVQHASATNTTQNHHEHTRSVSMLRACLIHRLITQNWQAAVNFLCKRWRWWTSADSITTLSTHITLCWSHAQLVQFLIRKKNHADQVPLNSKCIMLADHQFTMQFQGDNDMIEDAANKQTWQDWVCSCCKF